MKKLHQLFMSLEGAVQSAFLDVFVGFCKARINNLTLGWGVLIIGRSKLGTVNDQYGCEHNLAAQEPRLDQVPLTDADSGTETTGQSHLSFAMKFNESSHVILLAFNSQEVGKSDV